MKEKIKAIILATQNDINEYLQSEVPLECLASDLDFKLYQMGKEIEEILDKAR